MTKHETQPIDFLRIVLVIAPLLMLAGIFAASFVSWRSQSDRLVAELRDALGEERAVDASTIASRYEAETSDQPTADWKAILAASSALNERYGGPFAWENEEAETYSSVLPPGAPWPEGDLVTAYADAASPIVARMETLLDSDATIWTPIVFESTQTRLPEAQGTRDVARVLRYSFQAAVYQGRADDAIQLVRIAQRLFGPNHQSYFLVDELVRGASYSFVVEALTESVAQGLWTDDQLGELESIVGVSWDWDGRWKMVVESETLNMVPYYQHPESRNVSSSATEPLALVVVAPSTMLDLVQHDRQLAAVGNAGTMRHADQVESLTTDYYRTPGRPTLDRLQQLPTFSTRYALDWATMSARSSAAALLHQRNDHQCLLTAIGIQRFYAVNDRWPKKLSEISPEFVPSRLTNDFTGATFAYQDDGETAKLWNQADADVTWAVHGHGPKPLVMKPSTSHKVTTP